MTGDNYGKMSNIRASLKKQVILGTFRTDDRWKLFLTMRWTARTTYSWNACNLQLIKRTAFTAQFSFSWSNFRLQAESVEKQMFRRHVRLSPHHSSSRLSRKSLWSHRCFVGLIKIQGFTPFVKTRFYSSFFQTSRTSSE